MEGANDFSTGSGILALEISAMMQGRKMLDDLSDVDTEIIAQAERGFYRKSVEIV